ncbi:MAG TPA: sensor histidine kinase [Trebonia sp.]|nr:sensor histidine kinase [Trebonia sp.]
MEALGPPVPRPLRLSRARLVVLDAGAAVAFTALLLTFALSGRHPAPGVPEWAVWLAEAGVGLPVAVRRLWPGAAFLAGLAASLIAAVLGLPYGYFASAAAGLYLVALGCRGPARLSASGAGLLAAVAVLAAAVAGSRSGAGTAVVIGVAATAGAWAVGQAVRERRARLRADSERLAEHAVSEERLRIARELHDVVAHSMSLIAVKAGVANHVARSRPEEAVDALRVIEDTSKQALTEMRRMLGVLRTDDTQPGELAPAPGLGDLPELARRAASAGVRVALSLRADPDVPAGVSLSAYRIVQEALTNVIRHAAPARCEVTVTARGGEVRIEVTDDGRPGRPVPPDGHHPGHGLAGMRERALVCGGELTAGPLGEGGFRVKARLPYQAGP